MLILKRYALKGCVHTLGHADKWLTCTQTHSSVYSHAQREYIDQGHCYLMANANGAPQSHQESWG